MTKVPRIESTPGPFTYRLVSVPAGMDQQRTTKLPLGPSQCLMQVDSQGNEYLLAVLNPLMAPGDAEFLVKAANEKVRRNNARRSRKRQGKT